MFANYNQIYLDFEVLKTIGFEDFKPVSESVILVLPINLSNEEIKENHDK